MLKAGLILLNAYINESKIIEANK